MKDPLQVSRSLEPVTHYFRMVKGAFTRDDVKNLELPRGLGHPGPCYFLVLEAKAGTTELWLQLKQAGLEPAGLGPPPQRRALARPSQPWSHILEVPGRACCGSGRSWSRRTPWPLDGTP